MSARPVALAAGTLRGVARAVAATVPDGFPFSTGGRFHIDGGFPIRQLEA